MSKATSEVLDLEDRDPELLNQHIEVSWDNIIGEPSGIRSPECAWSISQQCFKFSRLGLYICLSVLCAPIAACLVGISFACLQFQYIWCITPCLRIWKILCGATQQFVRGFTYGMVIPIMEAFGYVLSQIRVRTGALKENTEPDDRDEKSLII